QQPVPAPQVASRRPQPNRPSRGGATRGHGGEAGWHDGGGERRQAKRRGRRQGPGRSGGEIGGSQEDRGRGHGHLGGKVHDRVGTSPGSRRGTRRDPVAGAGRV